MENDFRYFDELLEELLFGEMSYEQLTKRCYALSQHIVTPHENSLGNVFPSPFVQCVLECYKIKNGFLSSVWYSKNELQAIKPNFEIRPIKFTRINQKGEFISYVFYNKSQIEEQETENKLCNNEIEFNKNEDNIKNSILSCIKEFNGFYGKSGIAKILKGSKSLKDNAHNKDALNSKYFGLLASSTLNLIETEIENLVNEGLLIVKKVALGRPVLYVQEKTEPTEIKPKEEIKEEDTNLEKIIKLINNDENVFITGHAGTGKSYILNKLKEQFDKKLTITSTTGIAAVNVKGQTLHSWAGVGICKGSVEKTAEKIMTKRSIKNQIQKCEMLAIDEVSMLDIHTFEYVDKVLRIIRETNAPFGGIQLILIGDFFQLPPVEIKERKEQKYCFESDLWKELNLKNVILTKSYRQNEENFIKALSNMRTNKLAASDIELLKSREFKELSTTSDILHIYATNIEADSYNQKMFNNINSKEYNLCAKDVVYKDGKPVLEAQEADNKILERIDSICRAEKNISLKTGARVMLLINLDFEKGLINGSCGTVDEIFDNYISINFDNGINYKVPRHDFEFYNNEILIAKRQQFPIRLAYGITIHKSQGMSLDKLVVDCSKIFEKGQAYVAISRIKTLEGLFLYNFDPKKVMVDEKVAQFYDNLETV